MDHHPRFDGLPGQGCVGPGRCGGHGGRLGGPLGSRAPTRPWASLPPTQSRGSGGLLGSPRERRGVCCPAQPGAHQAGRSRHQTETQSCSSPAGALLFTSDRKVDSEPQGFPGGSSGKSGGVSGVSSSCGARGGFLPRHDEDLREPLVRRQGSQVSMRVARGSVPMTPNL